MPATTVLMTVEEFRQLPETGPFYYELRHGEPAQVTRPKRKHAVIQRKLERFLEKQGGDTFWVQEEMPFRPLPEHELWVADIGVVTMDRWNATSLEDNVAGVPELTIEILSQSNTVAEMNDRERLCLENGCLEFRVVDPNLRQVKVSKPDGNAHTYKAEDEIPLTLFGAAQLPVNEMFP